MHDPRMMTSQNMQTMSSSLGQKRPLSPEARYEPFTEGKRRATTDHKPILQVDCTMVPPRPTPQLLHFPASSPFHVKSSTTYSNTVGYSTSLNHHYQHVWPQAAASNWAQYTETMHSILSANNLPHHSDVGFIEPCKTSLGSSSSYSVFSSLSGLSSSQNPFGDLSGVLPQESQSSLSAQAETNKENFINVVIVRLRRLQNVLAEQSSMVEEVLDEAVKVLRGQRRAWQSE